MSDVLDTPDLYDSDDGAGGYLLKSIGEVKADAPYGTWPVVAVVPAVPEFAGNLRTDTHVFL